MKQTMEVPVVDAEDVSVVAAVVAATAVEVPVVVAVEVPVVPAVWPISVTGHRPLKIIISVGMVYNEDKVPCI